MQPGRFVAAAPPSVSHFEFLGENFQSRKNIFQKNKKQNPKNGRCILATKKASPSDTCWRRTWSAWALERIRQRLCKGNIIRMQARVDCHSAIQYWEGVVTRAPKTVRASVKWKVGETPQKGEPFPPKDLQVFSVVVERERGPFDWVLQRVRRLGAVGKVIRMRFLDRDSVTQTWWGHITAKRPDGTVMVQWKQYPRMALLFPPPARARVTPLSVWVAQDGPKVCTGGREASRHGGRDACQSDPANGGHSGAAEGLTPPAQAARNKKGLDKVFISFNCRTARAPWTQKELGLWLRRRGALCCALLETQWLTAPDIEGFVVHHLPKTKTSQGVAMLVDADVKSSGFESMGDRMLAVTIGEGKDSLRAFAFHAPHSGKDEKVLSEWWASAEEFAERQRIPGVPTIGLGDANATLVHKTKTRTLKQKQNKGAKHLTAFMQSQGYVASNAMFDKPVRKLETFVGASSAPEGVRRAQLDVCLIRGQWKSSVKDVRSVPPPIPSDHRPLVVTIRLKVKARKAQSLATGGEPPPDWGALRRPGTPVWRDPFHWHLEAWAWMYGAARWRVGPSEPRASEPNGGPPYMAGPSFLKYAPIGMLDEVFAERVVALKPHTYTEFVKTVKLVGSEVVPPRESWQPRGMGEPFRDYTARSIQELPAMFRKLKGTYDEETDDRVRQCITQFRDEVGRRPKRAWEAVKAILGKKKIAAYPTKSTPKEIHDCLVRINGTPNHTPAPLFRTRLDKNVVNCDPFELSEVATAGRQLGGGKATSTDEMPGEVFKLAALHELVLEYALEYQKGVVPLETLLTRIALVPKKGDLTLVENFRPIALVSVFLKLLNRMVLNRLRALDRHIRYSQNGFRPDRSTKENALALRILVEQAQLTGEPLVALFIDSKQAFPSITFSAIRAALVSFAVPEPFIQMVLQCYTGHTCSLPVPERGGGSIDYVVETGVLQGDTVAPYLFVLVLDAILDLAIEPELGLPLTTEAPPQQTRNAYHEERGLQHRSSKDYYYIRGAETPYFERYLTDLAYADDLCFLCRSVADAEKQLHRYEALAMQCGLFTNMAKGKTEVVVLNADATKPPDCEPMRGTHGATVGCVEKYTYLGTSPTHPLDNFRVRVGMAWAAAKQYETLWKHPGVGVDLKVMFFRALVESSLTYGLEMVTLSVENMREIDTAHSRLLRYCTRRDRDAYYAYDNGAIPHMSSTCVYNQIMLVGHALRHDSALGRVLLRTERTVCHTRRLTLEKSLQRQITRGATRIPREEWYHLAQDRDQWRDLARCAAWSREDDVYSALGREKRARWGDIERLRNRVWLAVLEFPTRSDHGSGKYQLWQHPPTKLQDLLGTRYLVSREPYVVPRLEMMEIPRRMNLFDTRPLGEVPRSCQLRIMQPARPHRLEALDYVDRMFKMNEGPTPNPKSRKGNSKPEGTEKKQPKTKFKKQGRRWKGPRKK